MGISNALWEFFEATGYIGAYLLYKDFCAVEEESAALDKMDC